MRWSPIFSETRFSLSFFLIAPAKKPRTECCCQSVAFMMAAIVAPFGSCSILSTTDCLEADDVGLEGGAFKAAALAGAVTLRAGVLCLTALAGFPGGLRLALAGFYFDLF